MWQDATAEDAEQTQSDLRGLLAAVGYTAPKESAWMARFDAVLLHPVYGLLVLIAVMGSNGPASLVGLDYARSHNPAERLGTASGIANMGGFVGTVVTLLGIGVLLDTLASADGTHTAEAYRWAFCWQYIPMAVGTAMILRLRRRLAH